MCTSGVDKGIWYDKTEQVLYIDYSHSCGTKVKIATWTGGLCVSRFDSTINSWFREDDWDPGIILPLGSTLTKDNALLTEYVDDIPTNVKEALAPILWRQLIFLKMIRI